MTSSFRGGSSTKPSASKLLSFYMYIYIIYIYIYITIYIYIYIYTYIYIGTRIISTFLRLVLTLNNFVFNSQNYLQIKGCAMGTKCAPSYANIFMGMFEERYIYPLLEKISNFYLRLINDIFLIWTGTTQQINEIQPSVKFDFNSSNKEINFLDTIVYKTQSGKLETKVYRKESDR